VILYLDTSSLVMETLLKAAHSAGFSILHPVVREGFVMEGSGFPWAFERER
jgi:hypothetical protein